MKTIKNFKDAGLVFVIGDKVDGVTGDPDSIPLDLAFRHATPHDVWTIRGFAWRANAGEKPSFKGMVAITRGRQQTFYGMLLTASIQ